MEVIVGHFGEMVDFISLEQVKDPGKLGVMLGKKARVLNCQKLREDRTELNRGWDG